MTALARDVLDSYLRRYRDGLDGFRDSALYAETARLAERLLIHVDMAMEDEQVGDLTRSRVLNRALLAILPDPVPLRRQHEQLLEFLKRAPLLVRLPGDGGEGL